MQPYNSARRYGGEGVSSVEGDMLYVQLGVMSASNLATLYIPCDIKDPQFLSVLPIDAESKEVLHSASGASAGFYANLETVYSATTVSALTALDYATGLAVEKGQLFNSSDDLQYVVTKTATTGGYGTGASVYSTVASAFAQDLSEKRLQQITPEKYIRMLVTPNATRVSFIYKVEGYNPY